MIEARESSVQTTRDGTTVSVVRSIDEENSFQVAIFLPQGHPLCNRHHHRLPVPVPDGWTSSGPSDNGSWRICFVFRCPSDITMTCHRVMEIVNRRILDDPCWPKRTL
jgi:hypothetical protein